MVMPEAGMEVLQGTPKKYELIAESGSQMVSHFCGDCGSTLYRKSSGLGNVIVKVGCIDDINALEDAKPAVKLYARPRVGWLPEVQGVKQNDGM